MTDNALADQNPLPNYSSEQVQAKSIIVIHPGSKYLRIGRSSDLNPHEMLHAIARRRYANGQTYGDPLLPKQIKHLSNEQIQDLEEARLQVSYTLQSCLQTNGQRRYATPPQQIAAFNRRSTPDILAKSDNQWNTSTKDYIIGDEILNLNPKEDYNIHFPYKRGDLNVHSGVGGSVSAIIANLETIWCWALENLLNINLKELKHHRAVLIVPDIYNRLYLKELTTLLLIKIGFGGCFLVQDHVAATFGAGLGYACVVDVGEQKTSISCVDDGISHRNTRLRMDYGGGDITQTFNWLLHKCSFPYTTCNPDNKLDAMLLQHLKEAFCHVNLDICGSHEKSFTVNQPEVPTQKFTLQVGDECLLAPLSLFTPDLFAITGPKQTHVQQANLGDSEDPHDAAYLRETSRRGPKEVSEQTVSTGDTETDMQTSLGQNEDELVVDGMETGNTGTQSKEVDKDNCPAPDHLLGLDQAVLHSIEQCPSEELKRKMYSCILIVGGGMKFQGIGTWLKNRISLQIPYVYRGEQLDITMNPKDMDPQITCWKGAAIMSCLESTPELWIEPNEWRLYGVKILRERATFIW